MKEIWDPWRRRTFCRLKEVKTLKKIVLLSYTGAKSFKSVMYWKMSARIPSTQLHNQRIDDKKLTAPLAPQTRKTIKSVQNINHDLACMTSTQ